MPRLEIQSGRHAGESYDVEKPAILGRGENVQVPVPDGKASREHCRVFQQAGNWVVVDLNSRNGITVNGVKTTRKNLNDGDTIQIGETVVMFRDQAAPAAGAGEVDVDEAQVDDVQVDDVQVDEIDVGSPANTPKPARPAQKRPAAQKPAARKAGSAKSARDKAFAEARAASKGSKARSGGGGAGSSDTGISVSDDVLQFNKVSGRGSLINFDLSQYSAGVQLLIAGAGLVVFALIVWGIFTAMGVEL